MISTAPRSAFEFANPGLEISAVWLLDARGQLTLWGSGGVLEHLDVRPFGNPIDIAVGDATSVWIVARAESGALNVVRRRGLAYDVLPTSLFADVRRVVGARDGGLWLLGDNLKRVRADGTEIEVPATGFRVEDFHEGPHGALWALGGMRRLGGFEVRCLTPGNTKWFLLPSPAAAVRISSAPDGTAWTVNDRGDVWRLHPNGGGSFAECQVYSGCTNCLFSARAKHAREISVCPSGLVWILSERAVSNGYAVEWLADFKLKEMRALAPELGAVRIAATAIPGKIPSASSNE